MQVLDRRRFLKQAAVAGAALATGLPSRHVLRADPESAPPAQVIVDPARSLAELDRNLFGSFLEHLGRAIYTGIFEPGSRLADEDGFRRDVLEEVRQLGVPLVRYPGGNFVSGYHWLDGVGPRNERPRVLERAWNSIEPNTFGTNEFMAWCRKANTQPYLAVNLGTGTPENAAALVEYCNVEKGTRWSDLRRRHGVEAPHGVKLWCLGNEMDGPWQIGHMTAAEYGRKAVDAARQMRAVDRSLQLVAAGSSGPGMATYLEWDRQVLEECYAEVDGLSLHRYVGNTGETGGDSSKFLALNLSLERQVREVAAVCDVVRVRLHSRKQLWLAFDEWNVWYRERDGNGKQHEAPPLLEETYNLEDALLVGGILNSLMRHAQRVRIACLAQLVNVIAPFKTSADKVLRQTIYYPYAWALQYARGRVLDLLVESPGYEAGDLGVTPYLDVAGTLDPKTGESCFFLLNRDLAKEREVTLVWRDSPSLKVQRWEVLTGKDLKAVNTFEDSQRVTPQPQEAPKQVKDRLTLKLPPRSHSLLRLASR